MTLTRNGTNMCNMNNTKNTNSSDTTLFDLYEVERAMWTFPNYRVFVGTTVRGVWVDSRVGTVTDEVSHDGFDRGVTVRWDDGEVTWTRLCDLMQVG